MLHHAIDCLLHVIETRNPAGLKSRRSHPKNESRLREVHIIHVEDYKRSILKLLLTRIAAEGFVRPPWLPEGSESA